MESAKHGQHCGEPLGPDGVAPTPERGGRKPGVAPVAKTEVRKPKFRVSRIVTSGAAILLLALTLRCFLLDPLTEAGSLRTPAVPVREMATELRAAGLAWDSANVTCNPGEEAVICHFANLRRTKRREGGTWMAAQGSVRLSLTSEHLWRVRGAGDLADLQFDLVDRGSNTAPAD